MVDSAQKPLRMTAREFVTCLALKLKGTNRPHGPHRPTVGSVS
jgi:hypothetical protein